MSRFSGRRSALEVLSVRVSDGSRLPSERETCLVRDALVDTIGCIHLGVQQASIRALLDAFVDEPGMSPIYGGGISLSPQRAALVNAAAAHVMDFDDWEVPGNTHVSAVLVPAILAAGSGQALAGMDVVDAYVAGFEVIARLGEAVNLEHYNAGWHSTGTLGAFGATAAVCRLWRLSTSETANALSLTFSRATGYTCQFGSDAKALQAGFAAETGIVSATLARAGLTGKPDIFENAKGFNALLAHGDEERFATAFQQELTGSALERHGLVIKAYPSCSYTHRHLDCAVSIHEALDGDVSKIERLSLHIPESHFSILPYRQPNCLAEALFSLPFCVAAGLRDGGLAPRQLRERLWEKPEVQSLIDRTDVHTFAVRRPDLIYDADDPDRLDVVLNDGRHISRSVAFPLGTPENPMSFERVVEKCLDNIGEDQSSHIQMLCDWPECQDVHGVLENIGAPRAGGGV